MNNKSAEILGFEKIIEQLVDLAVSEEAKLKLSNIEMILDEKICNIKMNETTQARRILDSLGTPPISSMQFMNAMLDRVEKGTMLIPEELILVVSFIKGCNNMKRYLERAEFLDTNLAMYGKGFENLEELSELIELSIRNNQVDNEASTGLKNIRRDIDVKREHIKSRLEKTMRSKREYLAEAFVTERSGRYALAVKREYKSQIEGAVLDTSRTGGTVFIEPASVGRLGEELNLLIIEEENEVRKVLYSLTNEVEAYSNQMKSNMDTMEVLDIAFAKAKLSVKLRAMEVKISTKHKLDIKQGKHPLLDSDKCVPLDFYMKEGVRGIIVTGPNTGGKTVSLKTVGLLSMMAQCGLHVPVAKGSTFRMFNQILCDIGDGQSIEENLSTFSSHIVNIIDILQRTTVDSLILLDELGSGTDPAEGMGIAIAILEALRQKGCTIAATTHYPEVKDYASQAIGYENARMCFDKESLKPLYKLEIGEAGESCAFYIASKLGFPQSLIELASSYTYKEEKQDWNQTNNTKKDNKLELKNHNSKNNKLKDNNSKQSSYKDTKTEIKKLYSSSTDLNKRLEKELITTNTPNLKQVSVKKENLTERAKSFNIGDSVLVFPNKEKGIVFHKVNDEGKIGVQIKGNKKWIMAKRLKLLVAASAMYPDDYDFSIIFDTVSNRKARHKIGTAHREGMQVSYDSEEESNWSK